MIKTILILVLMLALLAVAYLTRPTEEDFRAFQAGPVERTAETPLGRVTLQVDPPPLDAQYVVQDRYLWTTVERDGDLVYIGAFGNWFRWNNGEARVAGEAPAEREAPAPRRLADDEHHAGVE